MIWPRKLSSLGFFDAVDGTNLNAESAQGAAPWIDVINLAIRNNGIFRTNQAAIIT
jgi:hypothetical protein